MDRRFLLAIVLSVMVLIAFQTWIAPPPERQPVDVSAPAATDSAGAPTPAAVEPPVLAATDPAGETPGAPDRLSASGLDRADAEDPNIVVTTEDYLPPLIGFFRRRARSAR